MERTGTSVLVLTPALLCVFPSPSFQTAKKHIVSKHSIPNDTFGPGLPSFGSLKTRKLHRREGEGRPTQKQAGYRGKSLDGGTMAGELGGD